MNCNHSRYELSQCLDGRLPAGRRAGVLQHAADCAPCGAFWNELQQAQQLVQRLRQPRVGSDFRETLFARIASGEGTPEAVFHEPVPTLTKVRYAFTGAAAAAAVIAAALWLAPGQTQRPGALVAAATIPTTPVGPRAEPLPSVQPPLIAATQPLGFHLVAREAARQLDQRYDAAASALRRVEGGDAKALPTVLENADEVHALGELLLDLRDRKRLLFTESEVEPDLRFAVRLLGESQRGRRDLQTMQAMVAPALRSNRLAAVSRTIAPVQLDRGEEMEVLQRLTAQRPDIFPKLFIVIGSSSGLDDDFAMLRSGTAFRFDDDCGPSWVAPRSEVESREGVWRWVFDRSQNGAAKVRVAPK
jgi:hypothetical protein